MFVGIEPMKKHAAPIIAAALLLLPVLYVGSYVTFMALTPNPHFAFNELGTSRLTAESFYWPLIRADRCLRPAAWDEERIIKQITDELDKVHL